MSNSVFRRSTPRLGHVSRKPPSDRTSTTSHKLGQENEGTDMFEMRSSVCASSSMSRCDGSSRFDSSACDARIVELQERQRLLNARREKLLSALSQSTPDGFGSSVESCHSTGCCSIPRHVSSRSQMRGGFGGLHAQVNNASGRGVRERGLLSHHPMLSSIDSAERKVGATLAKKWPPSASPGNYKELLRTSVENEYVCKMGGFLVEDQRHAYSFGHERRFLPVTELHCGMKKKTNLRSDGVLSCEPRLYYATSALCDDVPGPGAYNPLYSKCSKNTRSSRSRKVNAI